MSYTQELLKKSTKEELISMYELLEQSKSYAWQKYYELKIETDKKQILFEEAINKLMKALDKACEQIASRSVIYDICRNRKDKCKYYKECSSNFEYPCPINRWNSNEWKEYLLQESEKE